MKKRVLMTSALTSSLLLPILGFTASAIEKPKQTVVLVHSAFTGAWAMDSVASELRKSGFHVVLPELPAHGNYKMLPKDVTFDNYVNVVLQELDKQEGKVILLGHSFAGTIISEVAEKRTDKVQTLVYLSAALLPNGISFLDKVKDSNSLLTNNLVIDNDNGSVAIKEGLINSVYAQEIPKDEFTAIEEKMVVEPIEPLSHKINISKEKFGTIPKYYIQTLRDNAIPQKLQREMYTETEVKQVFTITSGHAPNLTNPVKVADIIKTINSIENLNISKKKEERIKKEILEKTNQWQKGFNLDAKNKVAKYSFKDYSQNALLQSMPIEFGTVEGKNSIAKYWQIVLNTGAADMKYLDRKILVVDENTALLSSPWSMNKIKGQITLEKWVKKGSKWFLVEDNFEVLEFLK
ncbi:alpha/beta fold hydrolase [Pigmentibacter sp. JX0631]|uniref:alpha/beta fold hydrolase n=1 Tax=Pigmentibacter sp. JX0631 TaxID=2976982 RepID=UPI002468DB7D|nr:alpha/beta fold hydrolase [Pigmentibacter sp. JX0631]WGL60594.1 alpha/beta fold hydrolase [Pigmentibacter sp. JX0631]